MAGQGVFLGWETLACEAIAMRRLSAPFPVRYATRIAYWFVTSRSAPSARAMQAFRDWLKAEMSMDVWQDGASAP